MLGFISAERFLDIGLVRTTHGYPGDFILPDSWKPKTDPFYTPKHEKLFLPLSISTSMK